jgi:putative ABC transport system permease protein
MGRLRELVFRLRHLLWRRHFERELAEEMEFHRSMSSLRTFGSMALAQDRARDVWLWPWLQSAAQDLRFAARLLARNPTFAGVAVLTLAVGIGANAAVFSVINSVLLEPLPYPRAEELVALRHVIPGAPGGAGSSASDGLLLSPSMYLTYAEKSRVFQSLGVWVPLTSTVTGLAEPEQVHVIGVSDGVLQALNVPPAAGRWLLAEDQVALPRPPPSPLGLSTRVMLGYGYWQRRFGGDPSAIGRTIVVDARPRQIVGVMPQGFRILNAEPEVIMPLAFVRARVTLDGFSFQGVARLRPGITIAQANADLARVVPIWMDSWSTTSAASSRSYQGWKITPALRPLKQEVVGRVTDVLWVVMATIGVVMLIACANVANLLLVHAEVRQRELSVRAALGAGRGRIIRSLMTESMLLGVMGGVLGVGLAYAGVRALLAIGPANLPRLNEISIGARTLGFTAALSLVSGLLFGLIPALKYSGPRISVALGSVGRTASTSRERHRVRSALVIVQVASALVLLISAGLMIRTFQSIRNVESGFTRPERLQIMLIYIPVSLVPEPERLTPMQHDIQDRLSSIPGVTSAAFASTMPMDGLGQTSGAILTEERRDAGTDTPPLRLFKYVSPGFFQTVGTRVVAGREITWTEVHGSRPVVTVSENLARELWGTPQAALGKRLRPSLETPWHEVIGVVQDVRENGVYQPAPATVYWPVTSTIRIVTFVVHSERAGTETFLSQIRQAVWSVNGSLPAAPRSMQEIYERSLAATSFTLVMLAIAASMALLLGVVGIYGVISYAVSQRRREIGIRAALGARQRELTGMFVRHGLVLAGIGVAIGLGAAAGLTRLMSSLLYGITPIDPATYLAVPLILVVATVLASYLPARRAAMVDPIEALKAE